uniref:RCC1-like domain-containing protein n=1 Tax=Photinus pyralis TaxID=7054 RepID=A0A1Y1KHK1_PHOPY
MMSLPLQNLFDLSCLLDNIDIQLCCRTENGIKQLLALVTGEGDIVLHYIYGELSAVVKRLTWFNESGKKIQAICFDPTCTWLLVVVLDSSLYIIPALSLVDKRQRIDCKWSLTDLTHFSKAPNVSDSKPLSLVWWQTLDCNQNALVGYEDGVIALISLTDGRCLATCNISDVVIRLYLCQDNSLDCVSLLINGESGQQWRLILEQHSTGYIWPPEINTSLSDSATSRLLSLKQIGAEKLAFFRQRFENRSGRRDSQASDSPSESSSHSDSLHVGPELLPHLCDTYFAPQYARNRYLFSAFYKPTCLLTIHAVDIESAPLYVHKLPRETNYLLLTNRLIYSVNESSNALSIISTQLSECRLDGDVEFNPLSLLAQFPFTKTDEKILNIYKLSDTSLFNEGKCKEAPSSVDHLKIRKPKIDTCVVITSAGVYRVCLSCSPIQLFVNLIVEEFNIDRAEKLAIIFGLNLQELLENCGDLLISEGAYHRGLILYKQAKVHLLKRVLKLAVSGDSRALLKFVQLCLTASKVDMSTATKIHMGNLAVMAYTELILRHNGIARVNTTKDFMNFLRLEEFYDQVLAVNVACQSGHWNIVTLLAKTRGLQPECVAAMAQILQSTNKVEVNNHDFLMALSEPSLTQSLLIYTACSRKLFCFVKCNAHKFPVDILQRLVIQLDPSQSVAYPVVRRLFQKRKFSTSVDSSVETNEFEAFNNNNVHVKEFIETFIWVLIELVSRTDHDEQYNIELLKNVGVPNCTMQAAYINKLPKLEPLSCGYEHAAVIRNGALFTMGVANSGCLGVGPVLLQSSPPKLVNTLAELKVKVLSVSCGRKHCLALTDCGVYAWGSNSYGQLGVGPLTCESPYPQMVGELHANAIVKVAAGQYHSMALTAHGTVYTWGWGIHGQLGHGCSANEHYPKLVKFNCPIVQIAAGHAHSLILTADGKLYGFGSNAFGQLENSNITGSKTTVPTWITVLPDIYTPIKRIAAAYFHNIAVRTDEGVYTWGASPQEVRLYQSKYSQKQNIVGTKSHEPWKSSLNVFSGNEKEPVEQVAVGFRHSAVLQGGKIFLCKNMEDEMSPPKLNNRDLGILSQRFLHVSCGLDFTIAMDHSGKLLAWGNNAMAQTLLGKSQDEEYKHKDGKVVIFKNTKRAIKIPHTVQNGTDLFPIEIPGLPSMAITYSPSDGDSYHNRDLLPSSILCVENNSESRTDKVKINGSSALEQIKQTASYTFGQKTLHYVLESYAGYYDTEGVLSKCLKVNNLQAASKIAMLEEHYSDSLGFQLQAFREYINRQKYDFSMHSCKLDADIYEVFAHEKTNYLSSSSSLDSIQQWSDDYEDQGGCESPCSISESGDMRQTMSQYVQSVKADSSPISTVSKLISDNPYRNMKNKMMDDDELLLQIKDPSAREITELGARLVEFYIKQTYCSENHILMQNILLKVVEFWLSNNLPVPILEHILLKNMDKYFYPLSILLFCKNYNDNLGDVIIKDDVIKQKPSGFLKEFSTKFCLQLCSMVLENVNKA